MKFIVTQDENDLKHAKIVDAKDLRQYVVMLAKRRGVDYRKLFIWRKMEIRVEERKVYTLRGVDQHDPSLLVNLLGLIPSSEAGKMAQRHHQAFHTDMRNETLTVVSLDGKPHLYLDEVEQWIAEKEQQ